MFFRSSVEGTVVSGWQAEVAPPGLFTGGIYESYGRGWLVQADPALDAALMMGDWNTLRVRAVGDRVTTWLNGTRMVDFEDAEDRRSRGFDRAPDTRWRRDQGALAASPCGGSRGMRRTETP